MQQALSARPVLPGLQACRRHRYGARRGPLGIDAWDALEVVWTTNGGLASSGAPIAVSLACE